MAHNVVVRLHAEYKPILSVLNVVLDLSSCLTDGIHTTSSEDDDTQVSFIDVEPDAITFRKCKSEVRFHIDRLEIYPTSCRGLRWNQSSELHLSLHARSTGDESQNGQKVIHKENGLLLPAAEENVGAQDAIVNRIKQCQNRCFCTGCGRRVFNPHSEFKRVLPLPSENWSDFADIWFCHNHQHGSKTEEIPVSKSSPAQPPGNPVGKSKSLVPRPGDCLVSCLYMLVDPSQVSQETVGITPVTKRLVCQRCGNFLGFVKGGESDQGTEHDDTSSSHRDGVYKIYLHAVKFLSPDDDISEDLCSPRNKIPKKPNDGVADSVVEDFLCQLLCDQSRQHTSFRFLVQSSHEEHSGNVPIVLLIWLLDQNLHVYSGEQPLYSKSSQNVYKVVPNHVLKVLYKGRFVDSRQSKSHEDKNNVFKAWERDNSVHAMDLPYPLCKQLLSLLIISTKQLPASQRSLNTFHVGYLQRR